METALTKHGADTSSVNEYQTDDYDDSDIIPATLSAHTDEKLNQITNNNEDSSRQSQPTPKTPALSDKDTSHDDAATEKKGKGPEADEHTESEITNHAA